MAPGGPSAEVDKLLNQCNLVEATTYEVITIFRVVGQRARLAASIAQEV